MLEVQPIIGMNTVLLKVPLDDAEFAASKLHLAAPLARQSGEPDSYWIGPDSWMLASDEMSAASMISVCRAALPNTLHSAVDYSSGLAGCRVVGANVREVLASGCGLDLRIPNYVENTCCGTRLAGISAIVVAESWNSFDVFVDRSYETYMMRWLRDTSNVVELAGNF